MAEILITSYFENSSGPVLGLSPTIRIWEVSSSSNTLIVGTPCGTGLPVDGTMSEISDCSSPVAKDGFYSFTFTQALGYNTNNTYLVRVNGGITLPVSFRYQTLSITPDVDIEGIGDAVWDTKASEHVGGSPTTMGQLLNNTYTSVETIRTNDIPAVFMLLNLVRKYNTNRTKIDVTAKTLTVYDDDCVTPLRIFRLLDHVGTPSVSEVCERTSILGTGSPLIAQDGYPTCS